MDDRNLEYIRGLETEVEKLRQFRHDQQELHEMNEALHQTNNILRQQLATVTSERDGIALLITSTKAELKEQLATVTAERDELVEALKQFAECDLNDSNCASLEVATRRIRSLAQAALATRHRNEGAGWWVILEE